MDKTILISFALLSFVFILLSVFLLYLKKNLNTKNDKSTFRQFVLDVVKESREVSDKTTFNQKTGGIGNSKNQLQQLENKINEVQRKLNESNVRMFEDKLQKLERQFGDLQEKVNKFLKSLN
jgi:polyhydroxyalkanoate synthesis regulator phasin